MQLLGERARRYTVQVHFSRGVMTVEVSNDAWKNELLLERHPSLRSAQRTGWRGNRGGTPPFMSRRRR